ncbi:DUF4349 domain-containing protein [Catalinimonas niigatensis]|uniref:DUF4349 domain-containing protein n=1 Tax=Catalinimonas niigatensis TaxID=1397264 RepID=UPI002665E905|nr:DUF4349 domain-containing protein [Catalinimonas niigatensis]WPP49294.1 DUF4349 domain-containing protein [Catalinimonas niigatensis]
MKNKISQCRIIYLIFIWVFFTACEQTDTDAVYNESDMEAGFEEMKSIPSTMQPPPSQQVNTITKKIIKSGSIEFRSENIEQDYQHIAELLPAFNAYLENENQSRSDQQIYYSLTLRVVSEQFDSLFHALTQMAGRIDRKSSNVEDVTEQFYDLETRIKNKKALEQRYVELLAKATAVKNILDIENNLNEIRTQIEQLEGQFNYLSKRIRYSAIHVSFYEVLPYTYDASQREGFAARILSALDNGWQGFLSFVVGLIGLWPFLMLIAGGTYIFRMLRLRWKSRK